MSAREMQQSFEKIVVQMNPDLAVTIKLTSDEIFEFLNKAQERYILNAYLGGDNTLSDTRTGSRLIDSLRPLVKRETITVDRTNPHTDKNTVVFFLPEDYRYYISSKSLVTRNLYETSDSDTITNKVINDSEVDNVLTKFDNNPILRHCYIVSEDREQWADSHIRLIHDKYTTVEALDLLYYRNPRRIDVISANKNAGNCELPESTHDEIVSLAVEIFVTEAKYRLNMKQE